jgi:hypothetical protein
MRPSAVCLALALVAGACGRGQAPTRQVVEAPVGRQAASTTTGSPIPVPAPAPRPALETSGNATRPPPVLVRGGGRELALPPWSSCWQAGNVGTCSDGRPPESPPDIGSPAELEVEFPAPDWRFSARATLTGEDCGREQSVELPATGPTTYRLAPIGPAGDYTITLFGRGRPGAGQKGDVSTTFRWHTPRAGANEAPSATASIVAGRGSEPPVSFGVEFSARALGVPTRTGTVGGSVVVTSGNGASMSIPLEPRNAGDCVPEGSLYLGAPAELGAQAARLGPAPFRYDVTLVLGSVSYRGTGTWPNDEIPDCSPCTALRFTPPLPAL